MAEFKRSILIEDNNDGTVTMVVYSSENEIDTYVMDMDFEAIISMSETNWAVQEVASELSERTVLIPNEAPTN